MRTTNLRLAAHLITKGHSFHAIDLTPEGFGAVTFGNEAQEDAESFDLGAQAPSKTLFDTYRALIRKVDEKRRTVV